MPVWVSSAYSSAWIPCCGAGGFTFCRTNVGSSACSVFAWGFPRCNKRLVTDSQSAPIRWVDDPNTLSRACSCIIVSVINLFPLIIIIIIIPINPALAVPKFVNKVQNLRQADSAILLNVFSYHIVVNFLIGRNMRKVLLF